VPLIRGSANRVNGQGLRLPRNRRSPLVRHDPVAWIVSPRNGVAQRPLWASYASRCAGAVTGL
jgi:hypothetical protein